MIVGSHSSPPLNEGCLCPFRTTKTHWNTRPHYQLRTSSYSKTNPSTYSHSTTFFHNLCPYLYPYSPSSSHYCQYSSHSFPYLFNISPIFLYCIGRNSVSNYSAPQTCSPWILPFQLINTLFVLTSTVLPLNAYSSWIYSAPNTPMISTFLSVHASTSSHSSCTPPATLLTKPSYLSIDNYFTLISPSYTPPARTPTSVCSSRTLSPATLPCTSFPPHSITSLSHFSSIHSQLLYFLSPH